MVNRVAVSLAETDTRSCLAALRDVSVSVPLAEIRLDLMQSYDLKLLREESPRPLIITCRPPREGGRFQGTETERLAILSRAIELGFAYVDVEWDSLEELRNKVGGQATSGTRLIASRHWLDSMPESLRGYYRELRAKADVVKLVGFAKSVLDILPVLKLLSGASSPVIALAMGGAGRLTRLLAPCFEHALLSYGALYSEGATAPGQMSLFEMLDLYRLDRVGPHTVIRLHLCDTAESADDIARKNREVASGESLYIGLVTTPREAAGLVSDLNRLSSRFVITADARILESYESAQNSKGR